MTTEAKTKQIKSIDDQYLSKKRTKRIVINSLILSLCLILGIAVILLSCIKIDLKPRFNSQAEYVEIKIDNNSDKILISKGDDLFSEFQNIYNNSLSTSVLTSLFTGNFYGYTIERLGTGANDTSGRFYESYSNGSGYGISSSLSSKLGSNYVHLHFKEDQTLYYADGSKVMGRFDKTRDIYYKDVYFTISSDENSSQVDFYFGVMDYGSYPTMIKISVEAQSYALYDFANEL